MLGLGGLGHLALQFSHAVGLETWAVTGQADKVKELKAMGASDVLVVGEDPGKAMTDAGGFDVVLSTTNSSKQVSSAFGGLRLNGRLISMGVTTDGPITGPSLSIPWRSCSASGRSVARVRTNAPTSWGAGAGRGGQCGDDPGPQAHHGPVRSAFAHFNGE